MPDADGKAPITSGSSGAGEGKGGDQKRKIAGKYDTVEDAIESLVKGSETSYHQVREEIGAVKQLLERVMMPIGTGNNQGQYGQSNQSSQYDDPYRRGRSARDDQDDDDFDPTEFLTRPGKILRQREERLTERMVGEISRRNAGMIANAATVLRFQQKNPDLDEYEDLVQGFLQNSTDSREPLDRRLKAAAKLTRERIANLKKSSRDEGDDERDAGRSPGSDEFVEGASDRSGRGSRSNEDEAGKTGTPDDELSDEVMQRKQWKSKRFAAPQRGS